MLLSPEQLRFCEVEEGDTGVASAPDFQWTVLRRHGRRPLAVLGRALLRANNECSGLAFWSELSIFETGSRRFAAALRHVVPEELGPAWCDAWLCDSPRDIRSLVVEHDPLAAFPGCQFHASPDRADIDHFRGAWAALLTAILGPSVMTRVSV